MSSSIMQAKNANVTRYDAPPQTGRNGDTSLLIFLLSRGVWVRMERGKRREKDALRLRQRAGPSAVGAYGSLGSSVFAFFFLSLSSRLRSSKFNSPSLSTRTEDKVAITILLYYTYYTYYLYYNFLLKEV